MPHPERKRTYIYNPSRPFKDNETGLVLLIIKEKAND
jgi:hypothetical protein